MSEARTIALRWNSLGEIGVVDKCACAAIVQSISDLIALLPDAERNRNCAEASRGK